MPFNGVLCSLKELFPQVDIRILKAVAIEHSNDIDTAVEFIVTDVLPALGAPSEFSHGVSKSEEVPDTSNSGDGAARLTMDQRTIACETVSSGNEIPSSVENVAVVDEQSSSSSDQGDAKHEPVNCFQSNSIPAEDGGSSGSASNSECHSSYVKAPGLGDGLFSRSFPGGLCETNTVGTLETEENLLNQVGFFSQSNASCSHNLNEFGGASSVLSSESPASSKHIMAEGEFAGNSDNQCDESNIDLNFKVEQFDIASVNADNSPPLTVSTRSGQIVKTDMLEEFIDDAKSYKKTLVSTMVSVLGLAKVVDDREREALEAKEKASKAGLDILAKVDDRKKWLTHAKEANHMQAGEVYGERSILATEVRELQSRLLSLADQKDKSLSVIEEIRKTLEARLATAEAEKMAAEKVKLEKEENALGELTEQEIIMDKVVEESKRLKQEAEENSNFREFLVDRGRIVDMLQGEIGVVCEDVRSLKERVDKHIPLGGLKYSGGFTRTSVSGFSNLEAESGEPAGPPVRDDVPVLISEPQDSKSIKECDIGVELVTSTGNHKVGVESVASKDDYKVASEDEWDMFEDVNEAHSVQSV